MELMMHHLKKNQSGFTLIELMIVVSIVAILGAIAYPSYLDSVRKGKRAEGRTALLELLQQQERYMTQNNTYLVIAANANQNAVPFKIYSGDGAASSAYKLGAEACSGTQTIDHCVRVFATPQYTDPAITRLELTSTGVKSCTGSNTSVCWK